MELSSDGGKIIAIEIGSSQSLLKALKNVNEGNIVILGFKKIRRINEDKAILLLQKLVNYAKSKKLAILSVGDDYIILAPANYKIFVETV